MPGPSRPQWPGSARAAIVLTLDNMGEAADINRKLWPDHQPVGSHYPVTQVLPKILPNLAKHDFPVTYFVETWSSLVYGDFIFDQIVSKGHEMAWHAWQHEAWGKLTSEKDEREEFERSFGKDGVQRFLEKGNQAEPYRGFRPPGGVFHGSRTLNLCHKYNLRYISPAGMHAARMKFGDDEASVTVLPFRWTTVDAYFYMDSFAKLREIKGEPTGGATMSPHTLEERFISQIDDAIQKGEYRSLLFHPFLTNTDDRIRIFETVVEYLVRKRDEGLVWLARCRDVDDWIRDNPDSVGRDPGIDSTTWR